MQAHAFGTCVCKCVQEFIRLRAFACVCACMYACACAYACVHWSVRVHARASSVKKAKTILLKSFHRSLPNQGDVCLTAPMFSASLDFRSVVMSLGKAQEASNMTYLCPLFVYWTKQSVSSLSKRIKRNRMAQPCSSDAKNRTHTTQI